MPAFYADRSGVALEHRVDDEREVAALLDAHWRILRRREGVLVFVPPPESLPREAIESAVAAGLADAAARGVHGKASTPFLLAAVARATEDRTVGANLALLERNAEVAGRIAVELAGRAREVRA